MSDTPPPQPPPPPPPTPPPPPPLILNTNATQQTSFALIESQIDECLWAQGYPELQKACFLARVCQKNTPLKCQYRQIHGILQQGPTCGLTALNMILNGKRTLQELLNSARLKHYTFNGEIFSAQYLYDLICDNLQIPNASSSAAFSITKTAKLFKAESVCNLHCSPSLICQMHEGYLNCPKVKEYLMAGSCLFVAYPFI